MNEVYEKKCEHRVLLECPFDPLGNLVCTGYGNIEYGPGQQDRPDVEGVLHDISAEEMRKLTLNEGGYDVGKVLVTTAEKEIVEAQAFMSNWSVRLFEETKPTALYISKIRAGADAFNFSPDYQVSISTSD
jgi:hypothetical protein